MNKDEHEAPRPISASDLRRDISDVLDQVEWCGRKYIIKRWGLAAGMLLGIDEYRELVVRAIRGAPPGSLRYKVVVGKRRRFRG